MYNAHDCRFDTPTINLFFMPNDFIEFVSNLEKYTNLELKFIDPAESKYPEKAFIDGEKISYPIGKLEDIEIFFMHYRTKEEAKEKWNLRCKRIHWDHLLIKLDDQNGLTEKNIQEFEKLPFKNKILFTSKKYNQYSSTVYLQNCERYGVTNTILEPFSKSKYINVTDLLNNL